MGLLDSITGWLRKEKSDIGDAIDDATESLDRDVQRKERELDATPEGRIEMIQGEIDDDPFAAIRDRIEGSTADADAEAEVDAIDGPVLDEPVSDEASPDDRVVDEPADEPADEPESPV